MSIFKRPSFESLLQKDKFFKRRSFADTHASVMTDPLQSQIRLLLLFLILLLQRPKEA